MFKKIVSLSLLLSSQVANAFTYNMVITEQELQKKVSAMMPLEKQKRYYSVVISDPEVELISETNEIGLFANLDLVILGNMKGAGRANIKGTISYDAKKGAFFFRDAKIVSLSIDQVPQQYEPMIKKLIQKALGKVLAKNPVYKFKDDNIKHKLAKSVLKSIEVKDDRLLITLGTF